MKSIFFETRLNPFDTGDLHIKQKIFSHQIFVVNFFQLAQESIIFTEILFSDNVEAMVDTRPLFSAVIKVICLLELLEAMTVDKSS